MSIEALGEAWRAQKASALIEPTLAFREEGLVLGAGTVLAVSDGGRRTIRMGSEGRLQALLAAAYGREANASALGHLRRAAARWNEGQDDLAAMHLALSGFGKLAQPQEAARRLFLADVLMEAGATPETLLKAMGLHDSVALQRYSPDQPRVPSGSGRTSGQWTADAGGPAGDEGGPTPASRPSEKPGRSMRLTPGKRPMSSATSARRARSAPNVPSAWRAAQPPASRPTAKPVFLPPPAPPVGLVRPVAPGETPPLFEDPPPAMLAQLAVRAARLSAPAVFAYVLLVPTRAGGKDQTVPIPGRPDMRLSRHSGDRLWRVVETNEAGHVTVTVQQADGVLRDKDGAIIGHVLPNDGVAIELHQTSPQFLKPGEPRACPVPSKDRYGRGPNSRARRYEDFVKQRINEPPTPSGMAYAFANPLTPKQAVVIDDCQRNTDTPIEIKGPGTERVIEAALKHFRSKEERGFLDSVDKRFLRQSEIQLEAVGDRPLVWIFEEATAAKYVQRLFALRDKGRERIAIRVLPWDGT